MKLNSLFLFFAFLVKLNGTVQIAVVGQCQGRHSELLGLVYQLIDPGQCREQGIVRMGMEVGEFAHENAVRGSHDPCQNLSLEVSPFLARLGEGAITGAFQWL